MKSGTRRPASLLTHADVVAALHRCKYDPASAEASLVALARRRESKHNSASASTNARNWEQGNADPLVGVVPVANASATAGKSTSKPTDSIGGLPGGKSDVGGNRWEDWSEDDRSAFLMHLGDKVRDSKFISSPPLVRAAVLGRFSRSTHSHLYTPCQHPLNQPYVNRVLPPRSTRIWMMWWKSFQRRATLTQ